MSTARTKDDPTSAAAGLFRSEALRAAEVRWFEPIRLPQPAMARWLLVSAMSLAAAAVLSLWLVEVADRVTAVGLLLPATGSLSLRAPVPGEVSELRVGNNDQVRKGDALLTIRQSRSAPSRPELAAQQLASLRQESRLAEEATLAELRVLEQEQVASRERLAALAREQQRQEATVVLHRRQQQVVSRRLQRLEALFRDGAVAEQRLDDARQAQIATRITLAEAEQQQHRLNSDIDALQGQLYRATLLIAAARLQSAQRQESLRREIAAAEAGAATSVTSPRNGRTFGLAVSAGARVRAGQILVHVLDESAPLEARLYLPSERTADLRSGQEVEIEVAAYPAARSGYLKATVTSISAAAINGRDVELPIETGTPVFEVRARLERQTLVVDGQSVALRPGWQLTANLLRDRLPLYQWLFAALAGRA